MARRKPDARTFGQDLMRGEHVVGGGRVTKPDAKTFSTGAARGGGSFPSQALKRKPASARAFGQDIVKGEGDIPADGLGPGKRKRRANAQVAGGGGGGWAKTNEAMAATRRQTASLGGLVHGMTTGPYDGRAGEEASVASGTGSSITDPVLAELIVSWFCPPAGLVLSPFAGESSIGIVTSRLRREFYGIELRAEQVAANDAQADFICKGYPRPVWHCGDAVTAALPEAADLIFSCPPYADLEVYSDDPRDVSTMDYPDFLEAYRAAIARACRVLRPDRFACFIVGEVRDRDGNYYGFVPDTIAAFRDAGMHFYNEFILVTAVGSLPVRTRKQFESSRKTGKTHQNVLVFVKGSARRAAEAIGSVEFGEGDPGAAPDAMDEFSKDEPLTRPPAHKAERVQAPSPGRVLPDRWKVSAAWITKQHDCTLAGIHARCGGGCCHSASFWPPMSAGAPGPDGRTACPKLGPAGCTFTAADKPVTCLLYPLVLNKSGTLVLHHRTTTAGSVCRGNFGNGPPLIDALAGHLVALFGQQQYDRVRADVLAGRDSYFDPGPDVLAAWAREKELEAARLPPEPRTGKPAGQCNDNATTMPAELSPCQRAGLIWLKRDDMRAPPGRLKKAAAVADVAAQVVNLPFGEFSRVVVAVDSAVTLAGILDGLVDAGRDVPVLGVMIGDDPTARLDALAPPGWRDTVQLVRGPHSIAEARIDGVDLDPAHEAQCAPLLAPGDLLWVRAARKKAPTSGA